MGVSSFTIQIHDRLFLKTTQGFFKKIMPETENSSATGIHGKFMFHDKQVLQVRAPFSL
jgi:hypothetical protein